MIFFDLTIEAVHRADVFKALGYDKASPPGDFILTRTDEIITSVPASLKACCRSAVITERERGVVRTDRGPIKSPAFVKLAESADTAVFALVTAGPGMDALLEQCDDSVDAMILDAIGSVLVEQGVEEIRKRLQAHLKKYISLPFSPGYCDYPLAEQQTVFDALGPNPLNVRLHPGSFMMMPVKTVSFVCAAGETPLQTNPCALCGLETCQMRRTASR